MSPRTTTLLGILILGTLPVWAQVNFTANDQIVPYEEPFGYGVNMGAYFGWLDDDLANISVGNPDLELPGVGVNTLRVALPEEFLEFFGYTIRETTFQHYSNIGSRENVAFIGYPSDEHQLQGISCPFWETGSFEKLYLPIWDNGENGTPINEENYYANYVYKMVSIYKDHVRFWELHNEPDLDVTGNGASAPGTPNNWFDNPPDPCDMAFAGPIFHYIRMLRISYEVIHTLDPDSYVAVGGIGVASFLDNLLRYTDNPVDGSVTDEYPLTGGAYFDVLSYHAYPAIDNSLREWSDEIGDFIYYRYSDRAAQGVVDYGDRFRNLLDQYGYNGITYPEKHFIVTETNVPRKSFVTYGSDRYQRNFGIKVAVGLQKVGVKQLHIFNLGDRSTEAQAQSEFDLMGMYKSLDGIGTEDIMVTELGIGYKTMSDALMNSTFDPVRTAQMQLPDEVDGGAFQLGGEYCYVLWAKTDTDRSEMANATYSFPSNIATGLLEYKEWDSSRDDLSYLTNSTNIQLTADPIFLEVANSAVFTAEAGEEQTVCGGESVQLQASASGGYGPYTFEWEGLGAGAIQEVNPANTTTYTVRVTDRNGTVATDEVTVNIGPFCNSSIGDLVFEDTNGNGIQESTDKGLAGVFVDLEGTDVMGNTINLTTSTDANGNYSFANLLEGEYRLTFKLPAAYYFAPKQMGGNADLDSDPDSFSGQTDVINLGEREKNISVDAGLVPVSVQGITLNCPQDTTIEIPKGNEGIVVEWTAPSALSNCPFGSLGVQVQEGLQSGSFFPLGTTTIKYFAFDGCSNEMTCSFDVNIEEVIDVVDPPVLPIESRIFPNPTSGLVNIDISKLRRDRGQLQIYDSSRQLMAQWSWDKEQETILELDLSFLPIGVYSVWILQELADPLHENLMIFR